MHPERTIPFLERFRPGAILGAGAVLALFPLAGIPFAPVAGDVALVALTAILAGGTGWAFREAKRLAALPLEVAPVGAVGWLDGGRVYRFRARLGRGRSLRDPEARVTWLPETGDPVEMATEWPTTSLCGPITLLVRDPFDRVRPPGRFTIRLTVRSEGRIWAAEATVPGDGVRKGRFGGVGVAGGRVCFDEGWAVVIDEAP